MTAHGKALAVLNRESTPSRRPLREGTYLTFMVERSTVPRIWRRECEACAGNGVRDHHGREVICGDCNGLGSYAVGSTRWEDEPCR